jgi:hypothetical protein
MAARCLICKFHPLTRFLFLKPSLFACGHTPHANDDKVRQPVVGSRVAAGGRVAVGGSVVSRPTNNCKLEMAAAHANYVILLGPTAAVTEK